MRINVAVPETHVSPDVLNAALETTTRVNESLLKDGHVPPFINAVNRVRWKPEPPGDEHFDHAGIVLGRGWGDCDDLAPWHAASLRVTGVDKGARAFVKRSGPERWHALVRRSSGKIEDPSLAAGMRGKLGARMSGLPLMPRAAVVGTYIARPQLALRPVTDRMGQVEAWQSRIDLPWHWAPGKSASDVAMVSLHASPIANQAIVGAAEGADLIAEVNGLPDEYRRRIGAVAMGCQGAPYEDIRAEYGKEHARAASAIVGSFFSSLTHPLKSLSHLAASPLGQTAISFIPGVGPVAATALKYSDPLLQKALAHGHHLPPEHRAAFLSQRRIAPGGLRDVHIHMAS